MSKYEEFLKNRNLLYSEIKNNGNPDLINDFQDKVDQYFKEYSSELIANLEDDAEKRYNKYKSLDPFPDIPPALLNSEDIFRYVSTVGILDKFNPDRLKSATYPLRLLGDILFWDKNGNTNKIHLAEKDEFVLTKNSVCFVELEPIIRLPYYLALRFNLKINQIYKGLLLGTGPIIDPGFVGKLYIPLHNLTTNDYIFQGGDELIYLEFTKISNSIQWQNTQNTKVDGLYIKYPEVKKERDLFRYIDDAVQGKIVDEDGKRLNYFNVRNSIPEIHKMAKSAENEVKQLKLIGAGAIFLTVIILLFTMILPTISLLRDTQQQLLNVEKNINDNYTNHRELLSKPEKNFNNQLFEQYNKALEDNNGKIYINNEIVLNDSLITKKGAKIEN